MLDNPYDGVNERDDEPDVAPPGIDAPDEDEADYCRRREAAEGPPDFDNLRAIADEAEALERADPGFGDRFEAAARTVASLTPDPVMPKRTPAQLARLMAPLAWIRRSDRRTLRENSYPAPLAEQSAHALEAFRVLYPDWQKWNDGKAARILTEVYRLPADAARAVLSELANPHALPPARPAKPIPPGDLPQLFPQDPTPTHRDEE